MVFFFQSNVVVLGSQQCYFHLGSSAKKHDEKKTNSQTFFCVDGGKRCGFLSGIIN